MPKEVESIGPMLLEDIKAVFDAKNTDRLSSEEVCEALAAMEGRPWAEYGKASKPISKHQLAKSLRGFRIAPENVRIGAKVPKGYRRQAFQEAWDRYACAKPPESTSEPLQRYNPDEITTSDAFQTATAESCSVSEPLHKNGVAFEKCEKPPSNGHCSG
jgi:Ni/Co efflux regulator RcnB